MKHIDSFPIPKDCDDELSPPFIRECQSLIAYIKKHNLDVGEASLKLNIVQEFNAEVVMLSLSNGYIASGDQHIAKLFVIECSEVDTLRFGITVVNETPRQKFRRIVDFCSIVGGVES